MQNWKIVLDFQNLIRSWNAGFPLSDKSEGDMNIIIIIFGRLFSIQAVYLSCQQEFMLLGTKIFGLCAGSPQDTVNCYFTADQWVGKLQTGGNIITEVDSIQALFSCVDSIQLSQASASSILWNVVKLSRGTQH